MFNRLLVINRFFLTLPGVPVLVPIRLTLPGVPLGRPILLADRNGVPVRTLTGLGVGGWWRLTGELDLTRFALRSSDTFVFAVESAGGTFSVSASASSGSTRWRFLLLMPCITPGTSGIRDLSSVTVEGQTGRIEGIPGVEVAAFSGVKAGRVTSR